MGRKRQTTPDDAELARAAQRELPYVADSYTELMRRYETSLVRYCARFLGDVSEAEDIAQEVMLRVFHALPTFEGRASFKTWLYRIAHNLCTTRYQRMVREGQMLKDYQRLHQRNLSTERPRHLSELEQLFSQLPEADREILALRFDSGLSLQEIAEVLGIGLSAVKMRLYRAAERLATLTGK